MSWDAVLKMGDQSQVDPPYVVLSSNTINHISKLT